MRALVTGATGFLGVQLVNELESSGYLVRILSRSEHSRYDTILCDLAKQNIPDSAFYQVDVIFHLAGYTHDTESSQDKWSSYYDLNVKATIALAEKAVKHNIKKFIFISSVKAGGIVFNDDCMSESNQEDPVEMYGLSKRQAEIKILKIGEESDMHVAIVRPSLIYGYNMKGNLATMYSGIKKGWFPSLPRINNKRSMICIYDLVQAILLVSTHKSSSGNIYIATDGKQYSSRYIYEIMCKSLNKDIPKWSFPLYFFFILAKIGDIVSVLPFNTYAYKKLFGNECYSSEKLYKLGFKPKYNMSSFFNN